MIRIKKPDEILKIENCCRIVGETLWELARQVKPGMTTGDLDRLADTAIRKQGGIPAFRGYRGYPANICVSVDSEVVHGIPGDRLLEEGQVVSIDIGVEKDGYFGDAARTLPVGMISDDKKRLLRITDEALLAGIRRARPGNRIKDISAAIQDHVERAGYAVVRDLVGHGIGSKLHEDPQIPNFIFSWNNPRVSEGMTFAIEPMVNAGGYKIRVQADEWTCVTADGSCSAHSEDTVVIERDGPRNLTRIPARQEVYG